MSKFKIGQIVRVITKHWLRPQARGEIVEYCPERRSAHTLRVKFEIVREGRGFEVEGESGQFLWLEEAQVEAIDDETDH